MNPFECAFDTSKKEMSGFYTDHVCKQVLDLDVGESKQVDLAGKQISDFRMTLGKVSQTRMVGVKFKTKVGVDGMLWVLRTK